MTTPNTRGHVHPVHAETLSQYIHRQLGCTVQELADTLGRDRGTLRNWWRRNDPLLWAAVAGCKAVTAPVGRVTRLGGNTGPCVVHWHLLEALAGEAQDAAGVLNRMAQRLEGIAGSMAVTEMAERAYDLHHAAKEIGYEPENE